MCPSCTREELHGLVYPSCTREELHGLVYPSCTREELHGLVCPSCTREELHGLVCMTKHLLGAHVMECCVYFRFFAEVNGLTGEKPSLRVSLWQTGYPCSVESYERAAFSSMVDWCCLAVSLSCVFRCLVS